MFRSIITTFLVQPDGCGFFGKVKAPRKSAETWQRHVAQAMTQATPRLPKSRSR